MSYRDDVAALEARVASLKSELAETEEMAAEARRLVRQHVIEAELATPCTAQWSEMKGDDRVRHCGSCNKNVYNVADLTRAEIDALIAQTEGRFCGRLFLRADGTVLTKDCTRHLRLRPSRLKVAVGVGALAAAVAVGAGVAAAQFAGPPEKTLSQLEAERMEIEELATTGYIEVGQVEAPEPEHYEEMSGGLQFDPTSLEEGRAGEPERHYQGRVSFTSQRPNN